MPDRALPRFDPAATALVLVDLQNFTVGLPTQPHDGAAVLANAVRLADACRLAGVLVVLIKVSSGGDGRLTLKPAADVQMPAFEFPAGSHDLPAVLGPKKGDVVVTKYNWGAFYGTDLDVQLRRRGKTQLIVGGIATNFGVESTVRQAHERGYAQVLVSDAMAAFSLQEHEAPLATIMPRIARVRTTDEVLAAL
jgi:nicotinamidase-related amidase